MNPRNHKPHLAMTMGDPMGVGPEVLVKSLRTLKRTAEITIFGHREILEKAAKVSGINFPKKQIVVEPVAHKLSARLSKKQCGQLSLAYIGGGVDAIKASTCDALVTGPICKEHIQQAGSKYPGHTEMLAGFIGSRRKTFLMMAAPGLRVTLVTLHVPLLQVPKLVSANLVYDAIQLTYEALVQRFAIRKPRLALAGLNPHAGEGGLFGNEEQKLLLPALKRARRKGINVEGPLAGDTVFCQAVNDEFDAVISLYHDQGLIPIKLLHFDEAVNMTLGLPFVRTSVDHGTAFDIAWQDKANPNSLIAAGKLATHLVKRGLYAN